MRGLKSPEQRIVDAYSESHPARGAWIEIGKYDKLNNTGSGRTPQGVRGLKYSQDF